MAGFNNGGQVPAWGNEKQVSTNTEKHAELVISMSTDLLLGKISEKHYINTLLMIATKLSTDEKSKDV